MPKTEIEKIFDSFALNGKITEQHAKDIKDILTSHLSSLLESCLPEEEKENPWVGKEYVDGFNSAIQQTRSNLKELLGNK